MLTARGATPMSSGPEIDSLKEFIRSWSPPSPAEQANINTKAESLARYRTLKALNQAIVDAKALLAASNSSPDTIAAVLKVGDLQHRLDSRRYLARKNTRKNTRKNRKNSRSRSRSRSTRNNRRNNNGNQHGI